MPSPLFSSIPAINTLVGAAPAGCRSFSLSGSSCTPFCAHPTRPLISCSVYCPCSLRAHGICSHAAPELICLAPQHSWAIGEIGCKQLFCKHSQQSARNERSTISTSGLALRRALVPSFWLQIPSLKVQYSVEHVIVSQRKPGTWKHTEYTPSCCWLVIHIQSIQYLAHLPGVVKVSCMHRWTQLMRLP